MSKHILKDLHFFTLILNILCFDVLYYLLLFSRSVVSNSLRSHELQHSGLPVHHQLPELAQTHVRWVGDAIQPSHPMLTLLLLPSIFPSIRVFSNESAFSIRWPKYWSFSFSISPSNEYSGYSSYFLYLCAYPLTVCCIYICFYNFLYFNPCTSSFKWLILSP